MTSARVWREHGRRYRNEAARCDRCGAMHFPPRKVCDCGSRELTPRTMADTGRIVTYTVIRTAPPGFVNLVPYIVAVLEMDDGARLMAQVADATPDEIEMGTRVRLEFRKITQQGQSGLVSYGHKAVLETGD